MKSSDTLRWHGLIPRLRRTFASMITAAALTTPLMAIDVETSDTTAYSSGGTDWAGKSESRIGNGKTNVDQTVYVLPFELPTVPSGESVTSATLTFTITGWHNWSDELVNLDLFGIDTVSSSNSVVASSHFVDGANPQSNGNAQLLDDNVATLSDIGPDAGSTTTVKVSGDFSAFVQSLYDNGASAGDYAFLVIAHDAALSGQAYYEVATANNSSNKPTVDIQFGASSPPSTRPDEVFVDVEDRAIAATGSHPWVGKDAARVGEGYDSGIASAYVLPVKLPVLQSGESIASATLSINIEGWSNWSDALNNVDLYGINGSETSAVVDTNDHFVDGANPQNPLATLLQNDWLTEADIGSQSNSGQTIPKTSNDLGAFFQSLYDNGAAGDEYAFLVLTHDQTMNLQRYYDITTANSTSLPKPKVDFVIASGGGTPPPPPPPPPPSGTTSIDGNGNVTIGDSDMESYGGQDASGSATVASDGSSVTLAGNTWKKVPLAYSVTSNTILEVTINASDTGEIAGIGLDNDNSFSDTARIFQLGGSQNFNNGIAISPSYSAGTGNATYVIDVGAHYTGAMNWLTFVADDDANSSANITFEDVKIYEQASSGTAPSFTSSPTISGSDNGNGSYDYTVTYGAANGNPSPTLTGVLTLNGVDVTSSMSGNTYTATQTSSSQSITWVVTASNGNPPNAVESASETVPAIATGGGEITLNEFSRDRAIFDAGLAVGLNGAEVPLTGTATPGAVIEGRAVSIDDGGATTTDWETIATANGSGNWSGEIIVPQSASWYQAHVRIKSNPGVYALMSNRFGSGLIVTMHEQSNLAQQLITSDNYTPLNVSVPDPEAVQMIELENRGYPSSSDQNAVPGPFRQINDANFFTTSMSHMAAQICEAAPGLKVLIVMDAKAGRAQNLTLDDNDDRRMWESVVALYDKVRQDGAKIGLMVNTHKNSMTDTKWAQYSCRSITGYKLDGSPCPKVNGRWHFDAGSASQYGDHIWADLIPGVLTGRTAVVMQDDGYGWPSDNDRNHGYYKQAFELSNNTNLPHNPFYASLWHNNARIGLLNNPSNDSSHYTYNDYYGKPNSARQRIFLALEAIGIVNIPEPKFDIITWTPNYVQLECSAGPVTTIAKQTGLPALNSGIDPEFSEAIGFRFNLSGSQPHDVRIVNKSTGQPANSGVVRVYPNSGTFNGSSKLYFRALTAAGSFDLNEYFLNQAHLHKPVMMIGPASSDPSYIGFEAVEVQPFVDIDLINNANNL